MMLQQSSSYRKKQPPVEVGTIEYIHVKLSAYLATTSNGTMNHKNNIHTMNRRLRPFNCVTLKLTHTQ